MSETTGGDAGAATGQARRATRPRSSGSRRSSCGSTPAGPSCARRSSSAARARAWSSTASRSSTRSPASSSGSTSTSSSASSNPLPRRPSRTDPATRSAPARRSRPPATLSFANSAFTVCSRGDGHLWSQSRYGRERNSTEAKWRETLEPTQQALSARRLRARQAEESPRIAFFVLRDHSSDERLHQPRLEARRSLRRPSRRVRLRARRAGQGAAEGG